MFQMDHTDEEEYYYDEAFDDEEEVYITPERKSKVGDIRLTQAGHSIIGAVLAVVLGTLGVIAGWDNSLLWQIVFTHGVLSLVFGTISLAWIAEERAVKWKEATIIMFLGIEVVLYLFVKEGLFPYMFERVEVKRK